MHGCMGTAVPFSSSLGEATTLYGYETDMKPRIDFVSAASLHVCIVLRRSSSRKNRRQCFCFGGFGTSKPPQNRSKSVLSILRFHEEVSCSSLPLIHPNLKISPTRCCFTADMLKDHCYRAPFTLSFENKSKESQHTSDIFIGQRFSQANC